MDARLEAGFRDQRAIAAPEGLLSAVAGRTRATRQRPGGRAFFGAVAGRVRTWPRATVGAGVAAVAFVAVVSTLLLSPVLRPDGHPGVNGGPSATASAEPVATPTPTPAASPSPTAGATQAATATATPSETPSLAPGAIRIDFQVMNGVYTAVCCYDPSEQIVPGSGTFTMSGALTGSGSFTDNVTYTPDGVFSVTRTFQTAQGRIDSMATVSDHISGTGQMTTSGPWSITGGSGSWASTAASGTLAGVMGTMVSQYTARPSTETWVGTVTP